MKREATSGVSQEDPVRSYENNRIYGPFRNITAGIGVGFLLAYG